MITILLNNDSIFMIAPGPGETRGHRGLPGEPRPQGAGGGL